jgi:hypothetical protein
VENMERGKKLLKNWKLQSDTPTSVSHDQLHYLLLNI